MSQLVPDELFTIGKLELEAIAEVRAVVATVPKR